MEHIMNLQPEPMKMIRNGRKTIELRLYDEKRQNISIGDTIKFTNTENTNDVLQVVVRDMYFFDSFKELYRNLPLLECGYTKDNIESANERDMEQYYSKQQQAKYGVVVMVWYHSKLDKKYLI
jgi:ASC-1-like (ASCH) protein